MKKPRNAVRLCHLLGDDVDDESVIPVASRQAAASEQEIVSIFTPPTLPRELLLACFVHIIDYKALCSAAQVSSRR